MINKNDLKEALMKGKKRLSELHPELNDIELQRILIKEYYNRVGEPLIKYSDAIHYHLVDRGGNVACFNGSAHLKQTTDSTRVTCANCLINM